MQNDKGKERCAALLGIQTHEQGLSLMEEHASQQKKTTDNQILLPLSCGNIASVVRAESFREVRKLDRNIKRFNFEC